MNIDGLHNPFGLRASDNKIVLIEDIDRMNNGLKCDCICPSCKEPFEARMGDIRRHHFAHSGRGCDETNVYLTGLYMLLAEYLSDGNELYLPPLTVFYNFPKNSVLTTENVEQYVSLRVPYMSPVYMKVVKEESKTCFDEDVQIIWAAEGKPKALLAKKRDSTLAIIIIPPNTVCKFQTTPSRYQDYSTLAIDLSETGELFQTKRKDEVFDYLKAQKNIYCWIHNNLISSVFPEIIAESKQYYDEYQKELKEEEERRQRKLEEEQKKLREKLEREEAERKRIQEECEKKRIQEEREREQARQEQEKKREEKAQKIKEAVTSKLKQHNIYIDENSVRSFIYDNKIFLERWIERRESDETLLRKYKAQIEKSKKGLPRVSTSEFLKAIRKRR